MFPRAGGPDRRFNNNRQIPVVRYGQVVLRAASGLHIVWSFSRVDAAQLLANAVSAMRVNGGATLR